MAESTKAPAAPAEKDAEGNLVNPHLPDFLKKDAGRWGWVNKGAEAEAGAQAPAAPAREESAYAKKRDPYKNWDPDSYKLVIQRHAREEAARETVRAEELKEKQRKRRARRLAQMRKAEAEGKEYVESSDSSDSSDEDADADVRESDSHMAANTGVAQFGTKNKMSVRNLRIREDTAKYLLNLNEDSAFYDAKTRSMRADPLPHVPASDKMYAGDNALRMTGDTGDMLKSQVFAWSAADRGHDVNLQANPTQVALMQRNHASKTSEVAKRKAAALRAKYGGEQHSSGAVPQSLLLGQSEDYKEYTTDGRVAGATAQGGIPSSKWQEGILTHGHSTVWGSWYDKHEREWGYACCYGTTRGALCTGDVGKAVWADQKLRRERAAAAAAADGTKSLAEQRAEAIAEGAVVSDHLHSALTPAEAAAAITAASLKVEGGSEPGSGGAVSIQKSSKGRVTASGLSELDRSRGYNGTGSRATNSEAAAAAAAAVAEASAAVKQQSDRWAPKPRDGKRVARSTFDDPMAHLMQGGEAEGEGGAPAAKQARRDT